MSRKIDAREVLKHLNELGYTEINSQQLKEFIRDLKKLIKYEEKLQSKIEISHSGYHADNDFSLSNNFPYSSTKSTFDEYESQNSRKNDIFTSLYSQETIASEAKKKKKESVISVHIKQPTMIRPKPVPHEHCIHDSCVTETGESTQQKSKSDSDLLKSGTLKSETSITRPSQSTTDSSRDIRCDVRPSGSSTRTCRSKIPLKPKCSFIRPRMCKTYKTDPVALYQQYQAEWKKQKIPGEDSRADLRWAIREKMLGDPCAMSKVTSVESIGRRRYNSCQA